MHSRFFLLLILCWSAAQACLAQPPSGPAEVAPGSSGPVVDATTLGCKADYQIIRCAITTAGRVTRIATKPHAGKQPANAPAAILTSAAVFTPGDVGKILIIAAARDWRAYLTEPTPLNARIIAVDAAGVATVEDIDGAARGPIVANADAEAEFFTDNTDAIHTAIEQQHKASAGFVRLPAGVIGLCPYVAKSWAATPVLDNYFKTRAVFTLRDGSVIRGAGSGNTRLKIGYFGEFEPYTTADAPKFRYSPLLFLFEPKEGQTTRSQIEGFTVEFPVSPVVMSGYTLATDTWNTCRPRHAVVATLRDVNVIDPRRNSRILNSSLGGIYGADNKLIAESSYEITDCDFETGGGCSIKNQNDLKPGQSGGKSVHLTNVVFRGGGNIATRHYPAAAKLTQADGATYIEVNTPSFSWHDFNAHSDQGEGPYQPWCRLRRAYTGAVKQVDTDAAGVTTLTLDSPAPVTKDACDLLINFGQGDKQIFVPGSAAITAGASTIRVRWGAAVSPEQAAALVGAPARVYYEEALVHCVRDGISPRRIKLDAATAAQLATGPTTLLGAGKLDLTVNAPDRVPGAFGHTFYVGHNVNFYINGMKIYDCAKRSFRVSSGGSEAADGRHELTAYEAYPARGMAALANNTTVFQPAEEFGGLLKLRRSRAMSVYAVSLDMDDHSTYVSQGGIVGPSIIRNSTVSGAVGGGDTTAENSQVDVTLTRFDADGNRANAGTLDAQSANLTLHGCTGSITLQNGGITADHSQISLAFLGDRAQYNQWKGALRGHFTDCDFTSYVTGLHDLTPVERLDFASRMMVVHSGVSPEAGASGANITGMFTVGHKNFPTVLVDRQKPFELGVHNALGARAAHLFALAPGRRQALYIDSRYDQFRVSAARVDDILFAAYQHGASNPDLLLAQSEYQIGAQITLQVASDSLTLHSNGKLKPTSLRPRRMGETITLQWNRERFCWFEEGSPATVTAKPTWDGMHGETAMLAKPTGRIRGWRCELQLSEPITLEAPGDYNTTTTAGAAPIYLGYEAKDWVDASDHLQLSADGGVTWRPVFANSLEQAYARGAELLVDPATGQLQNISKQKLLVRLKTIRGREWKEVAE